MTCSISIYRMPDTLKMATGDNGQLLALLGLHSLNGASSALRKERWPTSCWLTVIPWKKSSWLKIPPEASW
jgi:hypothetical protein